MNALSRTWLIVAGLLGASAVALGAVGAHAVSEANAVSALERASTYQLIHAVALVGLAGLTCRVMTLARILMLAGVIGFSGSIYAKYLLNMPALGKFAPAGGTLLILSWLVVVMAAIMASNNRSDSMTKT